VNLSASRLVTFERCRHAYQLKYQRRIPEAPIRASQLGLALHATLADFYSWPAYRGFPGMAVLLDSWTVALAKYQLTERQQEQGWKYLQTYYEHYLEPLNGQWIEPLATEGRMEADFLIGGLRFHATGRYDRLDFLEGEGLHLIDYKLNETTPTDSLALDLQLGLYALMLEQVYQKSLVLVSHLYLSTGRRESFAVTDEQQTLVRAKILELAQALVQEEDFHPNAGAHCRSCSVKLFCTSHTPNAQPVAEQPLRLQLALVLE